MKPPALLYLEEEGTMEGNVHIRIVRVAKAAMFALFGLNLVRIAYRTWRYGGSKELKEETFDFGEPPEEGEGTGIGGEE